MIRMLLSLALATLIAWVGVTATHHGVHHALETAHAMHAQGDDACCDAVGGSGPCALAAVVLAASEAATPQRDRIAPPRPADVAATSIRAGVPTGPPRA